MHLQKCLKHHVEMGFGALNIAPLCDMFNVLCCTRQPCKVVRLKLYFKNSHVHIFAPCYYGGLLNTLVALFKFTSFEFVLMTSIDVLGIINKDIYDLERPSVLEI